MHATTQTGCMGWVLLQKLLSYARSLQRNISYRVSSSIGSMLSVCGFGHSALQPFKACVSVWSMDTQCAYTKLTFRLYHATAQLFYLHCTCDCSIMKPTFYLHQPPSWLYILCDIIPGGNCLLLKFIETQQ